MSKLWRAGGGRGAAIVSSDFLHAGGGVYRHLPTGRFYERPWIRGRRTWRKLAGHNLKLAREDFARRRTDQARAVRGMARDPYLGRELTVGDVLDLYAEAGCPDRRHQARAGSKLRGELGRLDVLRGFWAGRIAERIQPVGDGREYFAWRRRRSRKPGAHGGRAVDLELSTLSNALAWARSLGRLAFNPLAEGRPRFRSPVIRHCRETAPRDAGELHSLAAWFFEVGESEVLGWQVLLEAFTGCRTAEVLALRWDAAPERPGFIDGGHLWLDRRKGGVNPFCLLHDGLAALLEVLRAWRVARFPRSPWFLPSPRVKGARVGHGALVKGLARAGPIVLGRPITSHGMRSYYVTVRRSQGAPDGQIAAEIGDRTGASIIASTYGDVPPNWQGRPGLGWLPEDGEAAWELVRSGRQRRKSGITSGLKAVGGDRA